MGRATKMGFGIKAKGASGKYEVGITNMYGMFRLEDFWSPYGGATREECEEFVERIEAAKTAISKDILSRRKKKVFNRS